MAFLQDWIIPFLVDYGLLAIFITMTLESACVPIPSEIVVPYGGVLAAQGHVTLWAVVVVATVANLVGSSIAYAAGRYGGRALVLRYGRYVFMSPHHLDVADRWFERRGEVTVFVTRMMPGVRTFISVPAGVARMPYVRFIVYSALGAFLWNLGLASPRLRLRCELGPPAGGLPPLEPSLLRGACRWPWSWRSPGSGGTRAASVPGERIDPDDPRARGHIRQCERFGIQYAGSHLCWRGRRTPASVVQGGGEDMLKARRLLAVLFVLALVVGVVGLVGCGSINHDDHCGSDRHHGRDDRHDRGDRHHDRPGRRLHARDPRHS